MLARNRVAHQRGPILPGCLAVALASLSSGATAQIVPPGGGGGMPGWQITYVYDGQTFTVSNAPEYTPFNGDWAQQNRIVSIAGSGWGVPAGYSATAFLAGSVSAVGFWTADGTTLAPNPPADAYFLVVSNVANGSGGTATPGSRTARNGFDDPNGGSNSIGKHLIRVHNSAGNWARSWHLSSQIDANPTTPPGNYLPVVVAVSGTLTVTPDTRAVILTRDGAHGEWVDGDGNTHGDTTYSYWNDDTDDNPPIHVSNTQYFHATWVGNWSNDYTWTWIPASGFWDPNPDTIYTSQQTMPDGAIHVDTSGNWAGQDSPTPYNVAYRATDNQDGATANPVYYLTVHDQWEKNYPDNVTPNVRENLQRISDWGVNNAPDPADISFTLSTTQSWSLGVGFDSDIGKWFLGTIGINVNGSWSFSTSVGIQVTAPNVPPGWGTYLERFDVYDHHDGIVDTYDPGGYTGTAPYHTKVPANPCGGIQVHYPYEQFHY